MLRRWSHPVLWAVTLVVGALSLVTLVMAEKQRVPNPADGSFTFLPPAFWLYLAVAMFLALFATTIWKYGLSEGYPSLLEGNGWTSWWMSILVGTIMIVFISPLPFVFPDRPVTIATWTLVLCIGVYLVALGLIEAVAILVKRVPK